MDLTVYTNYMKNMRQRLHQTPELCYNEHLTQSILLDEIQKMGYTFKIVNTGIICDLIVGAEKTLAFRADMDGLRIEEKNDVAFKSRNKGLMHACGHDGHMSIMLGLMQYLKQNLPNQNIRFIFQPAEEGEGGALQMINSGALVGIDEIFAIHLAPDIDKGHIGVCYGVSMAGTVEFDIEILGKSCHAAEREKGADALGCGIVVASELIELSGRLQKKDVLLHIGILEGGSSRNVVASLARLSLTLRFFTDEAYKPVIDKVQDIILKIDKQYNTTSTLTILSKYIPVRNAKNSVDKVMRVCANRTILLSRKYTAEDFAYYVDKVPGAIMWLGVNSGENESLHSATFNFNEDCLTYGLETYIKLINET